MSWVEASRLDRVDEHRSRGEWIAGLWGAEDSKLLKVDKESNFFVDADGTSLRMTRPFVEFDPQRHMLLGLVEDRAVFAVEALPDGPMANLRDVGAQLSPLDLEIATAAVAILNWHRTDRHCVRCGTPTTVAQGGFMRRCPNCDATAFPRNDAAVIVAVTDPADRLLLGHQQQWPEARMSLLAGFVEAGESLEHAVHREMAEEADLTLSSMSYFGSQPWPFPRSLMTGFFAHADSDHICVDESEITHARWFTRAELRIAVENGDVTLPMRASIACRMIKHWMTHPG